MTTKMKQSRQARALAQREAEFKVWTAGNAATEEMSDRCAEYKGHEDKANKASREITSLKTKLGVRSEA